MRPCTELNPCDPPTKYAVVLDEQPIPDSLTSCSGRSERAQHASMIDAVTESCPHPAHSVDMLPSYWRRVIPRVLVGSDGWATLGLLMYDMLCSSILSRYRGQPRRLGELRSNAVDDGFGRHRQPAVAQDGVEFRLLHRGLERQQRSQLSVAVLLDDENSRMGLQKSFNVAIERKRLDPQIVHLDFLPPEDIERFTNGTVAAAEAHDADFVAALAYHDGLGQVLRRVREFPLQAVEHHLVFGRILGISAILIVTRAAGEVGALGTGSRQSAVRDRIVVAVDVAIELIQTRQLLRRQNL